MPLSRISRLAANSHPREAPWLAVAQYEIAIG